MRKDSNGSQIGFGLIAIAVFAIALLGVQVAVAEDASSNGAGGNKARSHETKIKATVKPGTHLHRRPISSSRASHPTVRNAIGVVVPEQQNVERPAAQHLQSVAVPHSPTPPDSVSKLPAHFATTGGAVAHRAYHPNAVVGGPSGTTIGGTSPMHRNSTASGIGGPATASSGINGTTVRPKH